uniref:SCP domain-containing protein n=2 Tax=Tetranychus urticae TaxID=32264 RepID=T1KLV2_TETUR
MLFMSLQMLLQPIQGWTPVNMGNCLSTHNYLRRLHGSPPLHWDHNLYRFARKRAEHMAATDIFAHPRHLPYGENLYYVWGAVPSCKSAVDAWYNEIRHFNYRWPTFSPATGHFTQVVWRGTRRVGCAAAQSRRTRRIYIACNYWPAGNVQGHFRHNVPHRG